MLIRSLFDYMALEPLGAAPDTCWLNRMKVLVFCEGDEDEGAAADSQPATFEEPRSEATRGRIAGVKLTMALGHLYPVTHVLNIACLRDCLLAAP